MKSLLCELPPAAYEYRGRIYEINTDFRIWIRFECLLADNDIAARDKYMPLLRLIFPEVPPDPEIWGFVVWFYLCGKTPSGTKKSGSSGKKQADVYSFEHDDGYIYSAFIEQYGIDLTATEYLHWWHFRAMFKSLHDCKFTEIMGYRAANIKEAPDYQKKFLEDMKRLYALPRSLSEQMKIDELKRIKDSYYA